MMRWNQKAFHQPTRDFSMQRALAILGGLREGHAPQALRQAS
jgi:hypothetical protein